MSEKLQLMESVLAVREPELEAYIKRRAENIVSNTQGDDWDDPEDWQSDAVELAHAVVRYFKGEGKK